MKFDNIKVQDGYILQEVTFYTKGYLTGYITCMLLEECSNKWYETLYRIHDVDNGEDYTLVSITYGNRINNIDIIFNKTEQVLTDFSKSINVDFAKLEIAQKEYNEVYLY